MAAQGHVASWPDKAMFASIMLVLAGAMGALYAAVAMLPNFTIGGTTIPAWLRDYPGWLQMVLSLATLVLGFVSLRAQRMWFAYAGCAAGAASLGFVGLVPILAVLAAGFLVQGRREGEDTPGARRLSSSDWPDKALAASLFILVAAVLSILWGVLILSNGSHPVLLHGMAWLEGGFDIAAGLWGLFAAWQVYHLKRPWTGYLAIGLAGLAMGLYLIGPILAATALVLLLKAGRENEFATA